MRPLFLLCALVLGLSAPMACSGTPTSPADPGLIPVVPFDAGDTPAGEDSSAPDAGRPEASGPDTTAPGRIADLRATAAGFDAVRLEWTAPGDDGNVGTVRSYEIRRAATEIATDADFAAATAVTPGPSVLSAGGAQTMTVTGLAPTTTYYFAVRALDEVPNRGPISNSPSASTFARAQLLVGEVAISNAAADGYDFVELVAIAAGHVDGLVVRQTSGPLHTFAPLEVQIGDRLVVHTTGLPGPTGFAQEDVTGNKTASTAAFASNNAIDVYSSSTGLVGSDNVISVVDGATTMDALAFSNRDGDVAAATMTAFAALRTANQWAYSAAPADGVNDCATQRESVSIATADSACGGFSVGATAGRSINRFGTTDTNSKRDFYVAAQTPGAANAAPAAPTVVSALAPTSATEIQVRFDQEIAPASVAAGAFSVTGLTVNAAALSDVHVVTLTTTAQAEATSYPVAVSNAIQNLQGVALGAPNSAVLCGYSPGATLLVNEVAPNQAGGADLVELLVTRGGSLAGMTLRADPTAAAAGTLLATFPAICAQANDLVVVHLTPPAMGSAPASESLSKSQYATASYARNFDNAWDVLGGNSGLGFSDHVVAIRSSAGTVIEAAAFSDQIGGATGTGFRDSLAYVQGLGLWMPPNCGGATCTDATTPSASAVSVDWRGVGIAPGDASVRRTAGANTHALADWSVGPSSLGLANP